LHHRSLKKGRHNVQISTLFYPEEEFRNKKVKEKEKEKMLLPCAPYTPSRMKIHSSTKNLFLLPCTLHACN
jgi:hypothetical protein